MLRSSMGVPNDIEMIWREIWLFGTGERRNAWRRKLHC